MLAIVSEKKRKKVELEAFSRLCLVSHTLHQVKVKQKKRVKVKIKKGSKSETYIKVNVKREKVEQRKLST